VLETETGTVSDDEATAGAMPGDVVVAVEVTMGEALVWAAGRGVLDFSVQPPPSTL